MAVQADPVTHKKLVLGKQLYQQAVVQAASQHSVIARIMCIIGLDLAVETVLKAVVVSLEPSKQLSDTFQGVLQQCDSLMTKSGMNPVPDQPNIQHVHSLRNDAQHKAKYPNESDVSDCRTYTRDFLEKLLRDVWTLEFGEVTLTDLVQDKEVKAYLSAAEECFGKADYVESVRNATAGLSWALLRVKTAIVGRSPSFTAAFMVVDSFGKPKEDKDAYRAFERMQETLLYIALGLNYSDYMRCRQIAGQVQFAIGGNPIFTSHLDQITKDQAEFVVGYSIDAVVQIESRVGDIDAPFGSDSWY